MSKEIRILGGARTPMAEYVGTPGGGKFKDLSAIELGARAVAESLELSGSLEPMLPWIEHVRRFSFDTGMILSEGLEGP